MTDKKPEISEMSASEIAMRKFLKQVGITSQKAIEDALRDAGNGNYKVDAKIVIKDVGLEHTVSGTINIGD